MLKNACYTYALKSEKCGKVAVYILARLFAIYPEWKANASSITYPAGSPTEIYTNILVHALPTSVDVFVSPPSCLIHIVLLVLLIFLKDENVQALGKANDYFTSFHAHTFYVYFCTHSSFAIFILTTDMDTTLSDHLEFTRVRTIRLRGKFSAGQLPWNSGDTRLDTWSQHL